MLHGVPTFLGVKLLSNFAPGEFNCSKAESKNNLLVGEMQHQHLVLDRTFVTSAPLTALKPTDSRLANEPEEFRLAEESKEHRMISSFL